MSLARVFKKIFVSVSLVSALSYSLFGLAILAWTGRPEHLRDLMAGPYCLLAFPIACVSLRNLKMAAMLSITYFMFRWVVFIGMVWPDFKAANPVESYPELVLFVFVTSMLLAWFVGKQTTTVGLGIEGPKHDAMPR